jgi:hypothetical protein
MEVVTESEYIIWYFVFTLAKSLHIRKGTRDPPMQD